MIDKALIDPNALQFYRMLKTAGFSAYFVGGSVRDLLLGKSPKDFDIATNATPQQIKRVIPQGRIIGRRFRHVMLEKQGGRYEIVTFRGPVVEAEQAELDDEAIEDQPTVEGTAPAGEEGAASRESRDSAEGGYRNGAEGGYRNGAEGGYRNGAEGGYRNGAEGGLRDGRGNDRGPRRNYPDLNQFGNAEQDAKRRDFTINALFYDPDADELVDYVEGKLDIDRRLIRSIGESQQRMEEDPIRILRAIRHKMKLGLEYDSSLEAAMRDKAPLLETTSKDRIREEFLKVCNDHSLGAFLSESRRIGLTPFTMPWFEGISEESWNQGMRLWEQLKSFPIPERASADLGLALMMVPLINPLVLEPYKLTLKENEKNYLPDMKYFLSCEPLRNFYLRNLRISRAQTDHIVRTLFYYSRMSGLWLEQGPPRRIVGRLFQHPPALLAAKMAKILLDLEGKETPPWILELAEYDPSSRRGGRRDDRGNRDGFDRGRGPGRDDRHPRHNDRGTDTRADGGPDEDGIPHEAAPDEESGEQPRRRETREEGREREYEPRSSRGAAETKVNRLPPPDQPMVWNGPLHAPVLRPNFSEEPTIRWARKNQTVRAYRPSGIPNQPTDHALLKSNLVYNYKPEIDPSAQRAQEEGGGEGRGERDGRRRGRDRGRGRGRGRDNRERSVEGEPRDRGPQQPQDGVEARAESDGQDLEPQNAHGVGEPEGAPAHRERGGHRAREPRNDDDAGNHRRHSNRNSSNHVSDEDSIGNVRRPGEAPAALAELESSSYEDEGGDDVDDNIGNRLDAPPTSGHVGINGEGVLGPSGGRPNQDRGGQGHGGGGGRRRGRRRGRRGGGGGQNRGSSRPSHP